MPIIRFGPLSRRVPWTICRDYTSKHSVSLSQSKFVDFIVREPMSGNEWQPVGRSDQEPYAL